MGLTRREFLAAAGGVAASGAMAGCAQAQQLGAGGVAPGPAVRDYTLRCGWIDTTLDGRRVRLRAYNGTVPGPLLETRPGDTLRIRVENALPHYDSTGWTGDHNVPHHLNTTNLHLHGMDVIPHLFEPLGTSDPLAAMIAIAPGETKEYTFRIPADHPSGLNWYHPHHHGSTAVQAVSGMAGGLVVRGAIDEVPEIRAAREVFLVINDIGLFPSETDPDLWLYEPAQNAIWQTFGGNVTRWNPATRKQEPSTLKSGFTTGDYALRYMLVNGAPFFREEHNAAKPQEPIGTQLGVPRFRMRPGEVVRFRMLNANSDNLMPIVVAGHDVHLIGLDGVNLAETRRIPAAGTEPPPDGQLLLAPSNRAEFLIRAGAPGVYPIVQLPQSQQFLVSERKSIAEIEVVGAPMDPPMAIPTTLPLPARQYPLIEETEISRIRNVVFSGGFPGILNPIVGIDLMINNALYDEQSVEAVVELDTAEEWHLSVPDSHHGGTEGHPFHIHVNSFEVISIGGVPQPPGTFRDTIWVPASQEVVIRMRFRDWVGKSVFHCHILPHEDTGMMQNFLIRRGSPHLRRS